MFFSSVFEPFFFKCPAGKDEDLSSLTALVYLESNEDGAYVFGLSAINVPGWAYK